MAEKDATTRLRRAVKENNLFLVKRLINRTDIRNPDPTNKRYTSLAWAAVLGHEETFEFLLSEGHDDREYSKDSENNTILILLADTRPPLASPYGSGPSDHDFYSATLRMARLYYDRYPDILDWANVQGRTALHVASLKGNEELVTMLCDLGADLDLADNEGNTPLHFASAWGHIPIVQLLIERGCQYSVRNNEGFTPSDYAYSMSTKDVLQDTARTQFELNKRARRNVYAQAAARGNEWGAIAGHMPTPPPRMYHTPSGSVRMRSGSGTSRTTTTSDSGDYDNYSPPQQSRNHPILTSSLSPSRHPTALPSGSYSPAQPSGSSLSSTSTFSIPSAGIQTHASLAPSSNPASALSPIANRMRERDADAMEKYKMRQRSGSATTASTDTQSQNSSNVPIPGSSAHDDDISALHSLVTGSVAPRRRLRPSASAAQLRGNVQSPTSPQSMHPSQETIRGRSGTSPAPLRHHQSPSYPTSSPSDSALLSTPTQSSARPSVIRGSASQEPDKYTGPPSEYARFPPPPAVPREPPERPSISSTTPTTQSRRLPFNLLSSHHKNSLDHHGTGAAHRRNTSTHSLGTKVA